MKKICLIDDDFIYRYTVKRLLEPYFEEEEFEEYEDGQLAIEDLETKLDNGELLSELFLVDVNMPMMDGWEFIEAFQEKLKQVEQKPKIYMVSSSNSTLDMEKSKTFECLNGYIVKPIDAEFIKGLLD